MTAPIGPYVPVLRAGDWVITSGQLGIVEGKLVEGGVTGQLKAAIANGKALLESASSSLDQVVKTTVFLVDMSDFADMNEAYVEAFGDHRPTRSAVAVRELPMGAQVEIEFWAYSP